MKSDRIVANLRKNINRTARSETHLSGGGRLDSASMSLMHATPGSVSDIPRTRLSIVFLLLLFLPVMLTPKLSVGMSVLAHSCIHLKLN